MGGPRAALVISVRRGAGRRGGPPAAGAGRRDRRDEWKEGLMAKRKAPAPSAKAAPAKGRPTKAEAAKAALKARQPDLLDPLRKSLRPRAPPRGRESPPPRDSGKPASWRLGKP